MGELLGMVADFLGEPQRFSLTSPEGIPYRTVEHLVVTLLATGIAAALALPPAAWLAHHRRGEALGGALVNLGRAIPSFGLIVVFWLLGSRAGISDLWPLVGALVLLAVPPIFINAYSGIAGVDRGTVEAARGQGMTEAEVFRHVELPLAADVILTGLRIALVQVLATVGIGAIVTSGGGLGRFVVDGFAVGVNGYGEVFTGAVLLAALVLVVEWTFSMLQRWALPTGLRSSEDRAGAGMDAAAGGGAA